MPDVEKSIIDVFREGLFWRALGRSAADNPYSPDSKLRHLVPGLELH
jgi:hypothetical protein